MNGTESMMLRSAVLLSVRNALFNLDLGSDWGCVALQFDAEAVVGAQFGIFAYRVDSGSEFVLFDIPFPDDFEADRLLCTRFCPTAAESGVVNFIVEFPATEDWLDRAAELIVNFAFKVFSSEICEKFRVFSYTVDSKRDLGIPEGQVVTERELRMALE